MANESLDVVDRNAVRDDQVPGRASSQVRAVSGAPRGEGQPLGDRVWLNSRPHLAPGGLPAIDMPRMHVTHEQPTRQARIVSQQRTYCLDVDGERHGSDRITVRDSRCSVWRGVSVSGVSSSRVTVRRIESTWEQRDLLVLKRSLS